MLKINCRASTYSRRDIALKKHINRRLGEIRIGDITTKHIDMFISEEIKSGKSTAGVHFSLVTIAAVLNLAKAWEIIETVPSFRRMQYKPKAWRWFSLEELEKIIQASPLVYGFGHMVTIAAHTGIRRGELLAAYMGGY